ncbi:hypothetical protein AX17_005114 [Amanita inopinata Kibby_2008]|nr:hypothetical protein AX17_005114 [Amanita inopinata Kibby_2008]
MNAILVPSESRVASACCDSQVACIAAREDNHSLVELKNGRVTLKQKSISFEKQSETLQEIVKFREFIEERIARHEPPLHDIPDEHKPLIAKLAHESDKTLSALVKHIRQELLPMQDDNAETKLSPESDVLPHSCVEVAIKSIMNRNNYGLDAPNGGKVPAAVCLWRWEVKPSYWEWLPKGGREKAEQRLAEREQAKKDLRAIFNALPHNEQLGIMGPKQPPKVMSKENPSETLSSKPIRDAKKQPNEDDEIIEAKSERPKKAVDADKSAKEKERKAAKAEKEKKEKDAQHKSRSMMANYFSKKGSTFKSTAVKQVDAKAGPSCAQSEFSKTFKPFVVKKDVQLAPINWLVNYRAVSKGKAAIRMHANDAIGLEDGPKDIVMADLHCQTLDIGSMTIKERLQSLSTTFPPPADLSRVQPPSRTGASYKTYHPIAIRELMSQLTEAEVSGDDGLVRSLLNKLRHHTDFTPKVIIFHEDARPGYFGTWTRNSRVVGARTPFAKDLMVYDYSYDSGEEWEDEGAGDADDVLDDDEEELGADETDSDLDSWLVDDDDIEVNVDDQEVSPPNIPEVVPNAPKRKVENEEKKSGKRRKVVVPLVPFAKGPCWETAIGECGYEPFKAYQVKILNDTPFPVDPFTFTSTCIEDRKPCQKGHVTDENTIPRPLISKGLTDTSHASSVPKRVTVAPRNAFPDTHLPFLLSKITTLQAASITYLVEAIYQELRIHKVKKNAIEAKVREVGEKCKEKKVWVIKPCLKAETS